MPPASQGPEIRPSNRSTVTVAVVGAVFVAAALAAAGALWVRYGTTVFFQTLAAGLAACF
jgi:hypothetical protein